LHPSGPGFFHHPLRLVAESLGQFAVAFQHLFRAEGALRVPRLVGRDLGGARSLQAVLLQMRFDLLAARA
jgi:hypothetical protein